VDYPRQRFGARPPSTPLALEASPSGCGKAGCDYNMSSESPLLDLAITRDFEEVESGTSHQIIYDYGLGIDCHSRFYQFVLLYRRGQDIVSKEWTVPARWSALVEIRHEIESFLSSIGLFDPSTGLRYTLESTGTYHTPCVLALEGIATIVNPSIASSAKRKTDRLDALLLARWSITGLWSPSYVPPPEIETLRVLLLLRSTQKRIALQHRNQINNILLRFGYTLALNGNLMGGEVRAKIEDICRGTDPLLTGLSGCPPTPPPPPPPVICQLLLDHFDSFDHHRNRADVLQERAVKHTESIRFVHPGGPVSGKHLLSLIKTVPGIGVTTGLIWLAVIGDVSRFPSAKHCAAFCGCDPSLRVSAGKVTSHKRRKGNAILHHALIQAAQGLLHRCNDPFGKWARAITARHRKGGYQKALGALARRLAMSLFYVHSKLEPFSYEKYALVESIHSYPNVPVSEVGLHQAAERILEAEGITTTHELLDRFFRDLGKIPGIGKTTLERIETWRKQHKHEPKSKKPSQSSRRESLSPDALSEERAASLERSRILSSLTRCSRKKASSKSNSGTPPAEPNPSR